MKKWLTDLNEYYPWFVDVWYYLLFIVVFIILALIFL
jgi:hypothetical protein